MTLRVYICPVIGNGVSAETAYRAKLPAVASWGAVIPVNASGQPLFNWCPVVVRASDWSLADADAQLERTFGVDLPDSIDTFAELKAFLQSKTVGDIPAARRTALNTRLTNHGIDTSQVTLATTWWQVLRGIYRHLLGDSFNGDGPRA